MTPPRDVVKENPPGLRGEVKGRQTDAKGLDAPRELGRSPGGAGLGLRKRVSRAGCPGSGSSSSVLVFTAEN